MTLREAWIAAKGGIISRPGEPGEQCERFFIDTGKAFQRDRYIGQGPAIREADILSEKWVVEPKDWAEDLWKELLELSEKNRNDEGDTWCINHLRGKVRPRLTSSDLRGLAVLISDLLEIKVDGVRVSAAWACEKLVSPLARFLNPDIK